MGHLAQRPDGDQHQSALHFSTPDSTSAALASVSRSLLAR
jgi:hypothetical protein